MCNLNQTGNINTYSDRRLRFRVEQLLRDHSSCVVVSSQTQIHGAQNTLVESVRKPAKGDNHVKPVMIGSMGSQYMPRNVDNGVPQSGIQ